MTQSAVYEGSNDAFNHHDDYVVVSLVKTLYSNCMVSLLWNVNLINFYLSLSSSLQKLYKPNLILSSAHHIS